jgi:transposase
LGVRVQPLYERALEFAGAKVMRVLHPNCAALDVHKKTVVASHRVQRGDGDADSTMRTFSTMTGDLLALSDWLIASGATHVAMESTGEYWRPVYNILEGMFTQESLFVVNATHTKNVPGRKTDANDAEWLAELLAHGLVRASFVPPPVQRQLRDLTRHRTNFIRERVNLVNRVQKTLESANVKLASVATDVMGKSGRAILEALVHGSTDTAAMAELSKGRLREKRELLAQALDGRVGAHHRFILSELLCQIDSLDETIARFDAAIDEACKAEAPFDEAVERLDTIPGIGRSAAEQIVAEIGTDMNRFPSEGHLCAWGGVAPGNHESGGKRLCGRIRQGNLSLRRVLIQAAHAAAHTKETSLASQFHRLAPRRGKKRAIVAVAHSILVICYHLIKDKQNYKELGPDYADHQKPEATVKRLVSRLVRLGYDVQLNPKAVPVAA